MATTAPAEPVAYADRGDEWLVAQCRDAADDDAFAELVRRHREPVFRLAVSILGQEFAPEAEEVAQDVMLRAHRGLRDFRGEARFGTWLYRIAFHRALNVKARARYRAPHVDDRALASTPSREPDPHDRLHDERRRRALLAGIGELPEVYQSAVRLHYGLGASVREIAELLDAPENTVKSWLHRARGLLHAMLAERGFDAR